MEMYVGNIPPNSKVEDLTLLFQPYGKILFVDIKNRCKPPFAFILFDNAGSAHNAAITTNGYVYQNYQLQTKVLHPPDENSNKITAKYVKPSTSKNAMKS